MPRSAHLPPFVLLLALALFAPACKRGGGNAADAGPDAASASVVRGVGNPGNDPALDALANGIKDCRFEDPLGFSYGKCEPLESLKKTAKDSPSGVTTMLNWLEDTSPPIRAAAAETLAAAGFKPHLFSGCAGGKRVKAALDAETLRITGWRLAWAWYEFARDCPAQDAEMQAFLKNSSFPIVMARQELMTRLKGDVLTRPGWFDTIAELAANEQQDPKVRLGTPAALVLMPENKREEAKAILRNLLKSADTALASHAARALATLNVDDAFEDVVAGATKDLATGAKNFWFFAALASYVGRKDAKIDRTKAFPVAESCAKDPKAYSVSRNSALDVLASGGAPHFKATAEAIARSKAEEDKPVAEHAKRQLEVGAKPTK